MSDLPTLEAALKLADQDCPLPSLAGQALKVLRAEIQRLRGVPLYGIDHGTGDLTVEAFGHADGNGNLHIDQILESDHLTENIGHGWLRRRPDGAKARCGGPALCRVCAKELADMMEIPTRNDGELPSC